MIPMVLDGFVQMLTAYESNNVKRLITGGFFGYGLFMIFAETTVMAFRFGMSLV